MTTSPAVATHPFGFRDATGADIDALVDLENRCFDIDRLTRRSFNWMIKKANCSLELICDKDQIIGYVLVLYHRGTHLARLYSLAVDPAYRGHHLGSTLLRRAEERAVSRRCVFMRLEVHTNNTQAIRLYESHDYRRFGQFEDYYEDHADAFRYQKRILITDNEKGLIQMPYYAQSTEFTCGPAALMMAMSGLEPTIVPERSLELQLWREATTIYMTSGHGGCSPLGLALAAWHRGFAVSVYVNSRAPLFTDGVRNEEKKTILKLVHEDFLQQIRDTDIKLVYREVTVPVLTRALEQGKVPLVMISSWRFNKTKSPHWVTISGIDDDFVYIHDPEIDEENHRYPMDNIHLPVARDIFEKAFRFGVSGLRTCVIISRREAP